MIFSINCDTERIKPPFGRLAASLVAMISFLRGMPLFVSVRPRTPLRVLCLMAFDTVHVLRFSRRMSSQKLQTLAALLDFGACANDFYDSKDFSLQEYQATRRLLKSAQTGTVVNEYVCRLRHLEMRRSLPGGDDRLHGKAQAYRESVIRLSLGMVAATALDDMTIEDGIQATYRDDDLETLYRIVMLCQIIDDVLDFAKDKNDGLPGFLTAHASPSQALTLTSAAALRYANRDSMPSLPHVFPFRVALMGVSVLAQVSISYGYWRLRWYSLRNWSASIVNWNASTDPHS
ncbi:hypothetical protein [uncultured Gimesia sp.]|uniref:hypothetical protein n=1 Tax=uncultured Gimesia sp. TaxID=1678688 RepID=UPI00263989BB|nr:hypothetical protein [uncultured Gimesia sp.]